MNIVEIRKLKKGDDLIVNQDSGVEYKAKFLEYFPDINPESIVIYDGGYILSKPIKDVSFPPKEKWVIVFKSKTKDDSFFAFSTVFPSYREALKHAERCEERPDYYRIVKVDWE